MEILTIETLKEIMPDLDSFHCDFLSQNCIAALEKNKHTAGCMLSTTGDNITTFGLKWSRKVNHKSFNNSTARTEKAAEAIALFLTPKLTEYRVVRQSETGTGFDYWLDYDENHELHNPRNFLLARLEVSGIDTETKVNTVDKRVNDKKIQVSKSDSMQLPAYIAIIEFSAPKAHFTKK
jgi:hypothetical protein